MRLALIEILRTPASCGAGGCGPFMARRSVIGTERLVLRSDLPAGMVVADPRVTHAHPLRAHVDVAPAQPEQFGLPKARRARRENDEPNDRAERVAVDRVVRDDVDHAVMLGWREELQIRVRSPARRRTDVKAATPSPASATT